jgi:hypothetical protein
MDYHEQIPGWFDFADIYNHLVERASDGAIFVEVGAYLGRSSIYLASRIKRSGKKIRLYVVDLWDGWVYSACQADASLSQAKDVFGEFVRNVRRAKVEDVIYPLKMSSEQAAELFEDGTLDFVFLDADHAYSSVRRDLEGWFPKVKRRGVLGGHDYLNPDCLDVRRAVDAFFQEQALPLQIHGTSYLAVKPSPRWVNASIRASRRLISPA